MKTTHTHTCVEQLVGIAYGSTYNDAMAAGFESVPDVLQTVWQASGGRQVCTTTRATNQSDEDFIAAHQSAKDTQLSAHPEV